jgi:hypothetical protein
MTFHIKKGKENLLVLIRKAGYIPTSYSFATKDEFNFIKPLSGRKGQYPRFHIYVEENFEKGDYIFNLHLDQKKASYGKYSDHSAEYEGEIIEKEARRIKEATERL